MSIGSFNAETQKTQRFAESEDFWLRGQSAAATPPSGAGERWKSGVALRFPPRSRKFSANLRALRGSAFEIIYEPH